MITNLYIVYYLLKILTYKNDIMIIVMMTLSRTINGVIKAMD